MRDMDKQREYQREWVARRRAEYLADKACAQCGSTANLEVDHIDPSQKDPRLRKGTSLWSWSAENRAVELAKCQVLCSVHHEEKTRRDREPEHGTKSRYSGRGCRCDPCTAANTEAVRQWRARLK